jgi:OmpA family
MSSTPSLGKGPYRDQSLETLRTLLISPEQAQLEEIKHLLNDPRSFARLVSSVLPSAVVESSSENEDLTYALKPALDSSIRSTLREERNFLVEIMSPVLGPSIRKLTRESLMKMVQSLEEALEHSFSMRGLQWRIESWQTGRPFAEVVIQNSLVYYVDQVFLIHKETGLLLHHLSSSLSVKSEPHMVSGMFTAIQDFISDSFNSSEGDALDTLQMGDLTVWVEYGTYANLAVVIKGSPPLDLRETMRSALFEVHADCSRDLQSFAGDTTHFTHLEPILQKCLLRQQVQKKHKGIIGTAIIVLLLCALLAGYLYHRNIENFQRQRELREEERWSSFLTRLQGTPGIIISAFEHKELPRKLYGLRDPLAPSPEQLLENSGFSATDVTFDLRSYVSLEEQFVVKRLQMQLSPPPEVQLSFQNGTLTAQGAARSTWIKRTRDIAPTLPGITSYDDSRVLDLSKQELRNLAASLERFYFLFHLGKSNCSLSLCAPFPENEPLFISVEDPTVGISTSEMAKLLKQLQFLAKETQRDVDITVVGRADSSGIHQKNILLSEERGRFITRSLFEQGVAPRLFTTESKIEKFSENSQLSDLPDDFKRGTSLVFTFHPPLEE